jgi:predicted glycoside hydrolase/deacetylase ChbG (UPF0249 family)
MKKIIINADDFGIYHDVNLAIVELFKRKALSSTTIMVTLGKSSAEAIELAKANKLAVGLHFNLTLGNDRFKNRQDFEKNYILGRVSRFYIQSELKKQYDYLVTQGVIPTHLDSHQHIHNWPGVFRIVARFAKEKNMPVRIPEEWPVFNKYEKPGLKDLKQLIRKILFLCLSKFNKLQALFMGVKTNSNLLSLFALWPRPAIYEEKYIQLLLDNAKKNTEYMCHPAVSNAELKNITSISDVSVQEYGLMTNDSFLAMISKNNIELVDYSKI